MRAVGIVALLVCAPAVGLSAPLSVEEAVKQALERDPRVQAAAARAAGASNAAKSARGRLLPALAISEEAQHYNQPFTIRFGEAPFTAREQNTSTFVASARQPIVGLLHRVPEYQADALRADSAEAELSAARAAVKEAVEVEYLRLFEARAAQALAEASERQLLEQVAVTEARLRAGAGTQADLLRVQVAAANARQQVIVARAQADVARSTILGMVGMAPSDEGVELAEPRGLIEEAQRALAERRAGAESAGEALEARPDVTAADRRAEAAGKRASARAWSMLPEVDAEAAYLRIDGQVFAPADQAYVGVRVQWPFWEWGATWFAKEAAEAEADAARAEAHGRRRDVEVEVASRLSMTRAATSAVALSERTIASAEEAYRVTDALVRAGAATTTDLLDAQATLTQARLALARARYQQAIAYVSLERALGK